jgi:phospholipase/carboxylesterase
MHTYRVTEKGKSIEKAQKAVILIHGRGAPPEDILGLADFFDDCKTWFAAPEAENHTWYPYSFLTHRYQNQPWLDSAIANIETLIKKTEEAYPCRKYLYHGFFAGSMPCCGSGSAKCPPLWRYSDFYRRAHWRLHQRVILQRGLCPNPGLYQ